MHLKYRTDKPRYYLVFAFTGYLLAQAFQQYVFLWGPLGNVSGMEDLIIAGQHTLNYIRHYLIYGSMILLIPAFIFLGIRFFNVNKWLSILASVSMVLFCLIELAYRSVWLFRVMPVLGARYVTAFAEEREIIALKYAAFFETVHVIYVPLLFFLFTGSVLLGLLALRTHEWLLLVAMTLSGIKNAGRLLGYMGLTGLNVWSDRLYFPFVVMIFSVLIAWSMKTDR